MNRSLQKNELGGKVGTIGRGGVDREPRDFALDKPSDAEHFYGPEHKPRPVPATPLSTTVFGVAKLRQTLVF